MVLSEFAEERFMKTFRKLLEVAVKQAATQRTSLQKMDSSDLVFPQFGEDCPKWNDDEESMAKERETLEQKIHEKEKGKNKMTMVDLNLPTEETLRKEILNIIEKVRVSDFKGKSQYFDIIFLHLQEKFYIEEKHKSHLKHIIKQQFRKFHHSS